MFDVCKPLNSKKKKKEFSRNKTYFVEKAVKTKVVSTAGVKVNWELVTEDESVIYMV